MNMRMIMPFSMYCNGCGECMYLGTKFNSKCEPVKNEDYLGVRIYRFYGKCKNCMHEFIFKTDPEHSDYTLEGGGTRSYEAWRDKKDAEAELQEKLEKEAQQDAMKQLEHKTYDLQEEMRRMDQLDELMRLNKRQRSAETNTEVLQEWLARQSPAASPQEDVEDEMEEFFSARAEKEAVEQKEAAKDKKVEQTPAAENADEAVPAKKKRAVLMVKKRDKPAEPPKVVRAEKNEPAATETPAPGPPAPPGETPAPAGLGLDYDSSE